MRFDILDDFALTNRYGGGALRSSPEPKGENMANKCIKCGDCCKSFEVFIGDSPENMAKRALIEKFVVDTMDVGFNRIDAMSVRIQGPCACFDEVKNRCRIYKNRPVRCREFYCKRSKDNGENKKK